MQGRRVLESVSWNSATPHESWDLVNNNHTSNSILNHYSTDGMSGTAELDVRSVFYIPRYHVQETAKETHVPLQSSHSPFTAQQLMNFRHKFRGIHSQNI